MTNTNTGSQDIANATSLSCQAPNRSIPRKTIDKTQAVFIDIDPDAK